MNKIRLINTDLFLYNDKFILSKKHIHEGPIIGRTYSNHNYQAIDEYLLYNGCDYTINSFHPKPKHTDESKLYRILYEKNLFFFLPEEKDTLYVYNQDNHGHVYIGESIATNDKNELIKEPSFRNGLYRAVANDDSLLRDNKKIFKQGLGLSDHRETVSIRPVLTYDQPDTMLKNSLRREVNHIKFKNKDFGIIKYGYSPQKVASRILEFSLDEIKDLERYKTGNTFTVFEQTDCSWRYNQTEPTQKDEYYIKGKRCILLPDYENCNYENFRFYFHPFMKKYFGSDTKPIFDPKLSCYYFPMNPKQVKYHAHMVRPIYWIVDYDMNTMISIDHVIHNFPIGEAKDDFTEFYPEQVPDTFASYLNDVFGVEMLQTYNPEKKQLVKNK